MGRAPCCDKANVKRGPWSPEEDSKLKSYIELHGTGGNWIALPQKIGLKRCGKSCRLRWLNYLRPNIKHGGFSEEEDNLICSLYISIGSRWSIIAAQLPGRTDNDIKNYWNTRLKKKLLGKHRNCKEHQAAARRTAASLKQQEIIKRGLIISSSSGNNGSMVNPVADSQNPYWPELPVLQVPAIPNYSSTNQELAVPSFNDHTSIRKLLIKLGGRFHSDHHDNVQPNIQHDYSSNADIQLPVDQFPSSTQQIYHDESAANNSSASPIAALASNSFSSGQFVQMNHHNNHTDNAGDDGAVNMFQLQGEQNSNYLLSHELMDMVYNIAPEKLDGLEFLYGEDIMIMMNDRPISSTTSTNSTSYGDQSTIGWSGDQMRLQVYPPPPPAASGSDYHEGMQRMIMTQDQCPTFSGLSSYPGNGVH